jgi:phosphoribosylglycinamide formyltransferase-1
MTARSTTTVPLSVVVLISGKGSNLQSILDHVAAGRLPIRVRAVISDRVEAAGLDLARAMRVPAFALLPRDFPDSEAFDAALMALIDREKPGLVVLAGFMRILGNAFVRHHRGRLLNIHPSLLPKYRGLHTYKRVLEAGEQMHGCSVHFVTEELDGGPVIAQASVPILPADTEASLRARVQQREHLLYPHAIGWFARGQLRLDRQHIQFDGAPLSSPKQLPWGEEYIP